MYSYFQSPVLPGKTLCNAIQFISGKTNSPRFHLHCTFSNSLIKNLANLTEPYNQGIKVQVTTEDLKQEYTLCMKSPPPEAESSKGAFQIQPPISGVNFSNNVTVPKAIVNMSETEHDTTFKTS